MRGAAVPFVLCFSHLPLLLMLEEMLWGRSRMLVPVVVSPQHHRTSQQQRPACQQWPRYCVEDNRSRLAPF